MGSEEIRKRFLKFFEERGHAIVPSSSLVPENDPSVLFTTAGMQQFKPYYIGKKDPKKDFNSLNTASVQKCVRTSDIDEVGDKHHLTFFEMLGNFSFGGYWKEKAIKDAYNFVTKEMGLKIDYVTVFDPSIDSKQEDNSLPADLESEGIWKSIDPNINVKKFGRADNFWGPTGEEGPCGPTTEIYVDGIEIWNIVFNEFYQNTDKTLRPLETKGIDTGMGFERLVKVVQKTPTVFETDLFKNIMILAQDLTAHTDNMRVIADHLRTAVFMIADGVWPSNTERGYILRRLIRRAIMKTEIKSLDPASISVFVNAVIDKYSDSYPEIKDEREKIKLTIKEENNKFIKTIEKGLREFEKGIDPFILFTTYGFPIEITQELAKERGIIIDQAKFDAQMKEHQEVSKAGMEQKFKGGLGGHSDMEVKYHTATHLLHQTLRDVLGKHVEQKGSNITPERLRFDFSHPQKMTEEEKRKVEDIVNQKIRENLPVNKIVLSKDEAERSGALHFFGDKYSDEVSIYYIGESLENAYSKEYCGGPHVSHTGELAGGTDSEKYSTRNENKKVFKIVKEEAVSAGVRRIKAVLS